MADLEINLFTIVLGTLIIGMGYVGLRFRYFFFNRDFYSLNIWDKLIQSIIIGVMGFVFTIYFGFIGIVDLTNDQMINDEKVRTYYKSIKKIQ